MSGSAAPAALLSTRFFRCWPARCPASVASIPVPDDEHAEEEQEQAEIEGSRRLLAESDELTSHVMTLASAKNHPCPHRDRRDTKNEAKPNRSKTLEYCPQAGGGLFKPSMAKSKECQHRSIRYGRLPDILRGRLP